MQANWTDNANLTGQGQSDSPIDDGTVSITSANLATDATAAEQTRQTLIAEQTPLPEPKLSLLQSIENDVGLT